MISAGSCDTPGQLADPSAQTPLRCEREQQRPHLRSHRRGLGRLLGTDVAPQAGRAQRSPSDGTLQHRHPAAVRTGGDGAPVRQGAAGAHRRGGDARRRPGPGNGPYGIRGRPGLCRASGAHGSQADRPGARARARPGPPGHRTPGARPSDARPTGGASAAGPSVARTPVRRAPRGTRAPRPSTSPLRRGRRRAGPARPALPGPRAAQADHRRPLPGLHSRSGGRGGRRSPCC